MTRNFYVKNADGERFLFLHTLPQGNFLFVGENKKIVIFSQIEKYTFDGFADEKSLHKTFI